MRILFWVPYPTEGASNRYRVEQYLPFLRKDGIGYELHPFWAPAAFKILYKKGHYLKKFYFLISGTISRISDIFRINKYDIVFIHREAYPIGGLFFEAIVARLNKKIIFDFDDAIFLCASSHSNSFIEKFKNSNKVAMIIKLSSHVISGNRYLADFALRYNHCVSVIPTPIDTEQYRPEGVKSENKIIIGWIGSFTTSDFLNLLENTFINLSRRFSNVKFKIIGGKICLEKICNIENKEWSLQEEIKELRTFDIGIMPMPENDWTKGKCGFKAILYMSMGIPCVCSPIGINREIIADGENGFLAGNENEWFSRLSLLIEDKELRKRMGASARNTVEKYYSVQVNAPKFVEIIGKVYNQRKRK